MSTITHRAWYQVNDRDVRTLRSHVSVSALNETVRNAVEKYYAGNKKLKNTCAVLLCLAQHSIKSYGVSWLKAESIAQLLSIDERTVRRALERLEKDAVIRRYQTRRKVSGLRGVDIVVIQPINSPETSHLNDLHIEEVSEHKSLNLSIFKKQDDDIYTNTRARIENLTDVQREVYAQAVDNGYDEDTAYRMALRVPGNKKGVTRRVIAEALKKLRDRLDDMTFEPVRSIPSYFATIIPDVISWIAQQLRAAKERAEEILRRKHEYEQLKKQYGSVELYNWLEEGMEEPTTYDELLQTSSPIYQSSRCMMGHRSPVLDLDIVSPNKGVYDEDLPWPF